MTTSHLFDLTGKVAVVTGGSGVLGAALAGGLADAGATVAIIARTPLKVAETVDRINAAGGKAMALPADVLDGDQMALAAERLNDLYGGVDILVNAAGGNRPDATATPGKNTFFDLPADALRAVVDLNLMGTLIPSQAFGKTMAQRRSGVIVNISSMAADRPLTRVVGYGGAKAAVDNITRWLAVTLAQQYGAGLRVNAIAPGFFLGDQNRALLIDAQSGELTPRGGQIIAHTPMARFGNPEDLIGTLVWLVSDAARFVTGIVVPVDGGFSAYSGV